MVKRKSVLGLLVVALLVTVPLLAGCGGGTPAEEEEVTTLESISITPETASIEVGQTKSYTATGTYSDGKTAVITAEVTWTSSDTAVATISSAGLATAVGAGTTTVTTTLDTVSGTATLTATTAPTGPSNIPAGHATAGCPVCHEQGIGDASKWPDNHAGFTEEICTSCHQAAE